ncbi:MAG: fused DSP-PTPase phosphatase/NAD kinase-like protein [Pyrinomonadaceae bacterium]
MRVNRSPFRAGAGALVAILVFSVLSFAQTSPQKGAFPEVRIKNFGRMDERFYRGAQPRAADYKALAAVGINTVIDLRHDPEDYARQSAEAAGLRYVNIPMIEKKYPRGEHVEEFLKLAGDPSTGKFYVHCAGGRHRTGVMGAVYRFNNYGWNFAQVYAEMKNFDFYTRWGHGDFKKFVEDYWQGVQAKGVQSSVAAAAGVSATTAASSSSAQANR